MDSCCLLDEKAGGRQQKSCGGGQEIIGRGSSIVRRKLAFFGTGTSFLCVGTQSTKNGKCRYLKESKHT